MPLMMVLCWVMRRRVDLWTQQRCYQRFKLLSGSRHSLHIRTRVAQYIIGTCFPHNSGISRRTLCKWSHHTFFKVSRKLTLDFNPLCTAGSLDLVSLIYLESTRWIHTMTTDQWTHETTVNPCHLDGLPVEGVDIYCHNNCHGPSFSGLILSDWLLLFSSWITPIIVWLKVFRKTCCSCAMTYFPTVSFSLALQCMLLLLLVITFFKAKYKSGNRLETE
jgi:hypothetical protein